ncbi:UNVERIFIED_CONTAM: hypothetical protein Sradi_4385700 [Sesamum radiatum]|uniref:DUF659 domain-containing protein n=1 Tax=Sesamum radiatum TaxID=300843 RepID=A0AAW2NP54_SESRA
MSKVASMGHGYTGLSYHALRVSLLKDAKKQVELIVDSFRSRWIEAGCTIMGDGWKDSRQRLLLKNLCNLFAEIVEMVGVKNVVHLVTDNAANYKAVGRLLSEKFPTICWTPCAAHFVNLILKDIGELSHVKDCAILASKVTCYIYNNKWPLNWLRQREGWTEVIRPGDTRFATVFIALKSLSDHKDDLQAMVTSQEFKKFLKKDMAKQVKQVVLDERFWNNCNIIVRVGTPLVRLLRICDSDEKPSLGWDKMLRKSLHAAAYYLNPAFQYDKESFVEKTEVLSGLLDYIDTKVENGGNKAYNEISLYRDRQKSFARPTAMTIARSTRPDFWIVEESPESELDYDELEEMLDEEVPRNEEESSFDPLIDEINDAEPIPEVDLDQFGRQSKSTYYSDNEDEDDWD